MANVHEEMDRAQKTGQEIRAADTDREALAIAFEGLGTLLLDVLYELREAAEARSS